MINWKEASPVSLKNNMHLLRKNGICCIDYTRMLNTHFYQQLTAFSQYVLNNKAFKEQNPS